MDIVHITRKGKIMEMIEKFYIYRETKLNNQINDKLTVKQNVIFETVVRQDPHRGSLPLTARCHQPSLSSDQATTMHTRKQEPKYSANVTTSDKTDPGHVENINVKEHL
jgi:hypothetical protein